MSICCPPHGALCAYVAIAWCLHAPCCPYQCAITCLCCPLCAKGGFCKIPPCTHVGQHLWPSCAHRLYPYCRLVVPIMCKVANVPRMCPSCLNPKVSLAKVSFMRKSFPSLGTFANQVPNVNVALVCQKVSHCMVPLQTKLPMIMITSCAIVSH